MKREIWIYDKETLVNFYCCVFTHRKTNETHVFEISKWKNDFFAYKEFLRTRVSGLWGFNNNNFDDPIASEIYKSSTQLNANQIYKIAQRTIETKYPKYNLPFKTADIYRMLHFDRSFTSLKWCEFQMDSTSIEEMPIEHYEEVNTRKEANSIINYCKYDVIETRKVINKYPNEIQLRLDITKDYKFRQPLSMSNTAIGKQSMMVDYCRLTGKSYYDVKELKTHRDYISLKDVISDKIVFKTDKMKKFLKYLKSKNDNLVYCKLKEEIFYDGVYHIMAKGGLHGTEGDKSSRGKINCKIKYESTVTHALLDWDFDSYYPNLMVNLGICPEHLDSVIFLQLVNSYTTERVGFKRQAKDKSLSPEIRAIAKKNAHTLKIKINALYGLMGEPNSFLYDLKAMYSVTLNGQLYLLMLIEDMLLNGHSCFYSNTDGASFIVDKSELDNAKRVCLDMSKRIGISGEFDFFKKAYISDVNNFVIIKESGDLKLKGKYVYDNIELNKNASNRIASKAAVYNLTRDIPLNKSIQDEDNIFLFCIGKRAKSTPKKGLPTFTLFKDGDRDHPIKLQKTIRYIITNRGDVIKSVYSDESEVFLEAYPNKKKSTNVWSMNLLNKVNSTKASDYDINYNYYLKEAMNLCKFRESNKVVISNQLKLF